MKLQKSEQLYQEKDHYGRQTNFKKQRNSKPHRNQWRKQLLQGYQKDNFAYNPQVKLTNPAKNELGRISYTG